MKARRRRPGALLAAGRAGPQPRRRGAAEVAAGAGRMLAAATALLLIAAAAHAGPSGPSTGPAAARAAGAPDPGAPNGGLLIPMDDAQSNHLKAYGVTYAVLERGGRAEWLLNYRAGSFLLEDTPENRRLAALEGITAEPVDAGAEARIRGTVESSNMEAVPLDKAPRVAVYTPPNSSPWDDAVTLALTYAGIPYERIWDREVLEGGLDRYDWLHLHHEDFTGQYSKFYLTYASADWLRDEVARNEALASELGFASVPALKKAVAGALLEYVEGGGFLFAMCTATETLELALAAGAVDIAAAFADGTPPEPGAETRLRWDRALAFEDATLVTDPGMSAFSDIDVHGVNTPWRRPLGSFELFEFSAKFDPVPTMLTQSHERVLPDFYGLTTTFRRERLKPDVTVLAEETGGGAVKYLHGSRGRGTFTYLGGHDPEDPRHLIGDPPTDLDLARHSPGYRLILNNVLFPAARKKKLKT